MDKVSEIISSRIEDLPQVAQALLDKMEFPMVLLIGDLGAGKTSLTKQFLSILGSEDAGSSPSYALINEYRLEDGRCYHLDLYRLNTVEEAFGLGLEDILYSGDYCFVEWPQLIMDYLEPPYHVLEIELVEGETRKFTLKVTST